MKQTILITGYTGYIGSQIYKELDKKKYNVVGINSKNVDISNREQTINFFKNTKIDYIIHTAAKLKGTYEEFININYNGTINIVDGAIMFGCKGIIFISTLDTYTGSDYGKSKTLAERYLIKNNNKIKSIILRFPGVFNKERTNGVIYSFIQLAKQNAEIRCHRIKIRVLYLKDAVESLLYFLEKIQITNKNHMLYEITSNTIPLKKLAKIIIKETKSKSRIIPDPVIVKKIKFPKNKITLTPIEESIKEMVN